MSIWTPLKQIRDWVIRLFRRNAKNLSDLISIAGADAANKLWPLILQKGLDVRGGKTTLEQAVVDVLKETRDVGIQDVRSLLQAQIK